MYKRQGRNGFTLIELSIVLVIIGLLVGGVLVGKDMINAAGVRAQISQIEKYNQAVNTFKAKYNALPGDMDAATAAQFSFVARGPYPGQGDGNGILEGNYANQINTNAAVKQAGEPLLFWVDLSQAGLIQGGFNTATPYPLPATVSGTGLSLYIPLASIGYGNYVYVWSGAVDSSTNAYKQTNINKFGISAVSSLATDGSLTSAVGLTVRQAYSIDTKIDDGLPISGSVVTEYLPNGNMPNWGGSDYPNGNNTSSSITCYDNNGSGGVAMERYSIAYNGGSGVNCAISIKFQ